MTTTRQIYQALYTRLPKQAAVALWMNQRSECSHDNRISAGGGESATVAAAKACHRGGLDR
jgi:hypothetical protein